MLRTYTINEPDFIQAASVLAPRPLPVTKLLPPTVTAPTMQTTVLPVNVPVAQVLPMQVAPVALTSAGVPLATLSMPINTMQPPAETSDNSFIWILAVAAGILLLTSKKKKKK